MDEEEKDYMDLDLSPYYDAEDEGWRKYGTIHENTTNNAMYKRARKRVVCGKTGKCDRCPWHGGENAGLSRQPQDDRHKNHRGK